MPWYWFKSDPRVIFMDKITSLNKLVEARRQYLRDTDSDRLTRFAIIGLNELDTFIKEHGISPIKTNINEIDSEPFDEILDRYSRYKSGKISLDTLRESVFSILDRLV